MTDTTPLPCPFCGGEAELESESCGWRVACTNVECFTQGPWPTDCTEAEAVTAWNTRANADARLVEALDNTNVGRAVMASVNLGKWLAAALEDPNVCDAMKADIREWFSAGEPLSAARAALSEVSHG